MNKMFGFKRNDCPQSVQIITHIHTDASNAEASIFDPLITPEIRRVCGADTPVGWSECFTPVNRLEKILKKGRGGRGRVDLIFITDHMRRPSHQIPDRHLEAAARDPRLAICSELLTRTRDADGQLRYGPEILAYGTPEQVEGPYGPYYGLTNALLEELFDTCMDDEGEELSTRRARDFLEDRGIAHGLSHPMDAHCLSFEGMFQIICESPYIETVNAGFPGLSAQILDAFIRLNNALLEGAEIEGELSPLGQRLVSHIRRFGRPLHRLGGSDAHIFDFDRVVSTYKPRCGRPIGEISPGDIFESMLDTADHSRGEQIFGVKGWPGGELARTAEVGVIVAANLMFNMRHLVLHPVKLTRTLVSAAVVTAGELKRTKDRHDKHMQQLQEFHPIELLSRLRMPDRAQQKLRA